MAKVLLVDDDQTFREALGRALTRAGHVVQLAADGEEALAALSDENRGTGVAIEPPAEPPGNVNRTITPGTGAPAESSTSTTKGSARVVPGVAGC